MEEEASGRMERKEAGVGGVGSPGGTRYRTEGESRTSSLRRRRHGTSTTFIGDGNNTTKGKNGKGRRGDGREEGGVRVSGSGRGMTARQERAKERGATNPSNCDLKEIGTDYRLSYRVVTDWWHYL